MIIELMLTFVLTMSLFGMFFYVNWFYSVAEALVVCRRAFYTAKRLQKEQSKDQKQQYQYIIEQLGNNFLPRLVAYYDTLHKRALVVINCTLVNIGTILAVFYYGGVMSQATQVILSVTTATIVVLRFDGSKIINDIRSIKDQITKL